MEVQELSAAMQKFVEAKGWYAPGSPKPQTIRNLALSLAIEAAEILEHVQWTETPSDPEALADELADVGLYLLQLARLAGIDLETAILDKLARNHTRDWE